ncbi:MAG: fibronectin type III domain-containing protein [candidate division Zixibacteria bacterium]|nr:fibronectin type III domain-containing protein [candidate division Zixibacteria bacterium]
MLALLFENFNTFNNTSFPSSQDYYGGNTSVAITDITNWQYVMMADMDVGATAAPNSPTLNIPLNGFLTGYQSVWFDWSNELCTSEYHIQIDDEPTFSTLIYEDSTLAYSCLDYSFHYNPDGWYYWRVRAGNSSGWSGWTENRSLMMDRKKPWGSVASSPDTATSSSFAVTWTVGQDSVPSSGICTYNILADTGAGSLVYWLTGVDSLSAEFTGAVSGRTYYFQARAVDCALNQEIQDPWWVPECSTYVNISGYEYLPGDANMYNGLWPPMVIGGDVTFLVNYFKGTSNPCLLDGFYASADVNGDCLVMGSDVIRLVAYFRGSGIIQYCSTYEPIWHNTSELPTSAPSGWPNCEP